jgi:C1A family cysteine protease
MKVFFVGLVIGILLGAIGLLGVIYGLYSLYKKYFKSKSKEQPVKRKYTCKKDRPDIHDYGFKASKPRTGPLPKSVDLRSKMSPVVDQGQLGSCTANAIVSGLWEYLWLGVGNILQRFSRLFLYYFERFVEGTVKDDSGAEIRDGMKILSKYGVCPESIWPYIIKKFTNKPVKKAIDAAGKYKIFEYRRINGLDELKAALADGQPVVFGFNVYQSFESDDVAKTGIVSMPKDGESLLGGHAVLAVGFDDTKGQVIVRNSWGDSWGDKGYFYMPYEVFNKLVMDMWTGTI